MQLLRFNLIFFKLFLRYLTVGLSILVLFLASQQMVLLDVSAQQSQVDPDVWPTGPGEPLEPPPSGSGDPDVWPTGPGEPLEPPPSVGQPPSSGGECPAQGCPSQPAPSCTNNFQYNQCTGCNESEPVYTNSCSGAFSTGSKQYDAACSSWCPTPQPTATPVPPTPTSAPAVVPPGSPSISASPFCDDSSSSITWSWSVPTNATTMDIIIPGSSNTNVPARNGSLTRSNLTPNQRFDGSITVRNSAGANSDTATATSISCQAVTSQPTPTPQPTQPPSYPTPTPPGPVCTPSLINTNQRCLGTQLCRFDVYRRSDCSTYEGSAYGCFNSSQCDYVTTPVCTPSSNTENVCVGVQLCTRTVSRRTDCSIVRGSPRNCFNATQCGYQQPILPTPQPPAGGQPPIIINNPPANINITQPHTQTQTQTTGAVTQTVNVPAQTTTVREVVREARTFGNVGVGTTAARVAGVTYAKELPKTGLPALAWAALAFIPAGFKIRGFSKAKEEAAAKAHFIWEDRQFRI